MRYHAQMSSIFGTSRRMSAWLGLLAMWLIVLAPMVSHFVVAGQSPTGWQSGLCSATRPAGQHDSPHADSLTACGYCDLLTTHAAMPPLPAPLVALLLSVTCIRVPRLSTGRVARATFCPGRPRAPPAR